MTTLCIITGAATLSFGFMYFITWLGCILDGRDW